MFGSGEMVIGTVVVIGDEVVVGDGGRVCIWNESENGIEIVSGEDTIKIDSVGVGSETHGSEVTTVSSTSF